MKERILYEKRIPVRESSFLYFFVEADFDFLVEQQLPPPSQQEQPEEPLNMPRTCLTM